MRNIPLAITLLAFLAACPETKRVPQEALVDVPAERVEELASMQRDIDELDRRIELQKVDVDQAQRALDLEDKRFATLEDRLDAERDLKRTAVERGDPNAARRADDNQSQIQQRMDTARSDYQQAQSMLRSETAELRSLEAERDFRDAQLQLVTAEAVADRRDDVDVSRYRQLAEEARLDWQQAQRERDQLRRSGQDDDRPVAP